MGELKEEDEEDDKEEDEEEERKEEGRREKLRFPLIATMKRGQADARGENRVKDEQHLQ